MSKKKIVEKQVLKHKSTPWGDIDPKKSQRTGKKHKMAGLRDRPHAEAGEFCSGGNTT